MCFKNLKFPRHTRTFQKFTIFMEGEKVVFLHLILPSGILPEGTGNPREYEGTILCLGLNEYFVNTQQKLRIYSIPLVF